jgi:hypothetical protein
MKATCSTETSVDFQRTTLRYIPEDTILQFIITNSSSSKDLGKYTVYPEIWSWFSPVPPGKCRESTSIRTGPLLSK